MCLYVSCKIFRCELHSYCGTLSQKSNAWHFAYKANIGTNVHYEIKKETAQKVCAALG